MFFAINGISCYEIVVLTVLTICKNSKISIKIVNSLSNWINGTSRHQIAKKKHGDSPFKEQIKKKCIKGKISKNIKKENLVKIGNCITLTKSPDTNFEYSLVSF